MLKNSRKRFGFFAVCTYSLYIHFAYVKCCIACPSEKPETTIVYGIYLCNMHCTANSHLPIVLNHFLMIQFFFNLFGSLYCIISICQLIHSMISWQTRSIWNWDIGFIHDPDGKCIKHGSNVESCLYHDRAWWDVSIPSIKWFVRAVF